MYANTQTRSLKTYESVDKATQSGREIEAAVLTKAAVKLKECQDGWDAPDLDNTGTTGLAFVHIYVYNNAMKRRELERRLRELGWWLQRHGGKHDVWCSPDGSFTEYVPRHSEINERLARAILKRAKERT